MEAINNVTELVAITDNNAIWWQHGSSDNSDNGHAVLMVAIAIQVLPTIHSPLKTRYNLITLMRGVQCALHEVPCVDQSNCHVKQVTTLCMGMSIARGSICKATAWVDSHIELPLAIESDIDGSAFEPSCSGFDL
eukprot:1100356-Amphidinium_carterae.2